MTTAGAAPARENGRSDWWKWLATFLAGILLTVAAAEVRKEPNPYVVDEQSLKQALNTNTAAVQKLTEEVKNLQVSQAIMQAQLEAIKKSK